MKTRQLCTTLLAAAILLTVFTGCDGLTINGEPADSLFSASGKIYDARATSEIRAGVPGARVTLIPIDVDSGVTGQTFSSVTSSSGSFTMHDIPSGKYRLTAEMDGWFIPPQEVSIGGMIQTIDDVPAFQLLQSDLWGLSFILTWNGTVDDLDLHLTFPTSWTDGNLEDMYEADDFYNGEIVNHAYSSYTPPGAAAAAVYMDRDDVDRYGPETMNLLRIPHDNTAGMTGTTSVASSRDTDYNGLYTAFGNTLGSNLRWYGKAVLYIDAFQSTENISTPTSSSDAKVYAIQTIADAGNLGYNLLGIYTVPEFTTNRTVSILRVNMLRDDIGEAFQLCWDGRTFPQGAGEDGINLRSLDTPVNPAVVGVRGIRY